MTYYDRCRQTVQTQPSLFLFPPFFFVHNLPPTPPSIRTNFTFKPFGDVKALKVLH